jgi:uncharacterized membrane protein YidH (DUF202 family)
LAQKREGSRGMATAAFGSFSPSGTAMLDLPETLIFALAIGFVISGIVSNVFQLVTNGRSVFHFPVTSDLRRLAMVGLLILAGPHILFRAANKSMQIGDWPAAYVFGSFALAVIWSIVLGYCVLAVFII